MFRTSIASINYSRFQIAEEYKANVDFKAGVLCSAGQELTARDEVDIDVVPLQ